VLNATHGSGKETIKEAARGISGETSTPETGKYIGVPQPANRTRCFLCYCGSTESAHHLTNKGKHFLDLASPGGASRNKTLGQNELALLPIPLPRLPKQQRIAEILSTLDREINGLEKGLTALERKKRGLMQKLLTGEVRVKV
jgi:hypothetical protein